MTGVVVGDPRRHAVGRRRAAPRRPDVIRIGLCALIATGLALRLWWLLRHTYAIENDGAEYARIAQNLVSGHGYVGLQPGPELLFPPLYPWLMTALSSVLSAEHAGRAVSLVFGSLLPVPMYLIANRLYGRRTAMTAAALAALSPLLIGYSTAVLSETTYITIQLVAAYLLLRAHDRRSVALAIAAGACWAFAALVRPEAALICAGLTVVGVAVTLVRAHRDTAHRMGYVAVPLVAFVVCCVGVLPSALWTSSHAGRLQWNGKATATAFINQRIADGHSYQTATLGVAASGEPEGVLLDPNSYISGAHGTAELISAHQLVRFEKAGVHRLWAAFGHDGKLGAPLVVPLALLGLLGGPWTRRQWGQHGLLALLGAANGAVFGAIGWYQFRFLLPLLPIVLIFAARGCVRIADLACAVSAKYRPNQRQATTWTTATVALLTIITLAVLPLRAAPGGKFPSLGQRGTSYAQAKTVGSWLGAQAGHAGSVMSTSATLAFYAGRSWFPMAYTDSEQAALAYLEQVAPTAVVATAGAAAQYQDRWATSGLPDRNYRPVQTFDFNGKLTVVFERVREN